MYGKLGFVWEKVQKAKLPPMFGYVEETKYHVIVRCLDGTRYDMIKSMVRILYL